MAPGGAEELEVQIRRDRPWWTLYRFSMEPQLPPDRELARHNLLGGEHVIRFRDGKVERKRLGDGASILDTLATHFRTSPRDDAERRASLGLLDALVRGGAER